ncbi:hypothetical protein KPB2_5562 [Klebsiella pneumoniae Kb677]|nr:hypothetical protein KPB2_5562 [Klebsiella pneumoniae Kb677]
MAARVITSRARLGPPKKRPRRHRQARRPVRVRRVALSPVLPSSTGASVSPGSRPRGKASGDTVGRRLLPPVGLLRRPFCFVRVAVLPLPCIDPLVSGMARVDRIASPPPASPAAPLQESWPMGGMQGSEDALRIRHAAVWRLPKRLGLPGV